MSREAFYAQEKNPFFFPFLFVTEADIVLKASLNIFIYYLPFSVTLLELLSEKNNINVNLSAFT